MTKRYSTLLVLAFCSLPAMGADVLSLDEAIDRTLESNFSFRIAALDPQIAREQVTTEEAVFDTEIFASGRVAQTEQPTVDSDTVPSSSDSRNWNAGARKRLVYGTTVTASTNLSRQSSNANSRLTPLSQAADLSVSVRQPLLQGRGKEANTARLERARAGFSATRENFRETVLQIIAAAEQAYWQVARWQEQLELNETNLQVAETLLDEARERHRVGMVTQIEVLQAEAFWAESQEEIIETRRILGDAYDQLLALMGSLPEAGFYMSPEQAVNPLPSVDEPVPDFSNAWTLALDNDPGLAAQSAVIDQRRWDRIAATNAQQPNLDLVVSGGYTGIDFQEAADAYEGAFNRDGHDWAITLEFSMPWSRRAEKANVSIADMQLEREELRYEDYRQSLYRDVRSAWRSLTAVQQSLEAARLTVGLQEATFDREKSKYEQGLSSFRDVLEVQRDLDQARGRMLRAKFDKLTAEIELARMTGTLFDRHGIVLEIPGLQ